MARTAVPACRPTMVDVARAAGISLKTVSRVLNAEPGVAPETDARVRAAVAQLGFTRNDIAAGLRRNGQATASIGLIIEDVANPFSSALTRAVEEVARERNFLVFAGSSAGDPVRERELAEAFCARRVDGLVIVPTASDHGYLAREVALGTGVVFADRPPMNLVADAALTANAAGARAALEHLIAHGHRRIAYVGDAPTIFTARERLRGYRNALRAREIKADASLVRSGVQDSAAAEAATRKLLSATDPPTAIFTGNNLLTVGAYRALRSMRRCIGLVGFDDFEFADLVDPPITTVAQDAAALGRAAAQLLFERLADPTRQPQTITLPTTLIARGSGEVSP